MNLRKERNEWVNDNITQLKNDFCALYSTTFREYCTEVYEEVMKGEKTQKGEIDVPENRD